MTDNEKKQSEAEKRTIERLAKEWAAKLVEESTKREKRKSTK